MLSYIYAQLHMHDVNYQKRKVINNKEKKKPQTKYGRIRGAEIKLEDKI